MENYDARKRMAPERYYEIVKGGLESYFGESQSPCPDATREDYEAGLHPGASIGGWIQVARQAEREQREKRIWEEARGQKFNPIVYRT